jgi:O-antigen/teichoic acid export membrane protein
MSDGAAIAAEPELPRAAGLARNAFYLFLGQLVTTALAILLNGALGRLLGPDDFGLYFIINSFAAFASVVVDWGQQFYGLREVARAPERGGELLGTGLALRTIGTAVICLPVGLVAWGLGYDARTRWLTIAFIFLSLPLVLAQFYGIVFRGRDRMGSDAAVSVINKAVGLLCTLAALYLGMGLGGVIVAQGLAGLAALALAARLYRRVAAGRINFSRPTAREMLVGGSAVVTMTLAVAVQPYIDAVLLSKLVPRDAIGWYGAAKNVMGTLFAPAIIVGSASFPRLSRAAEDPPSFARELQTAIRPMLWLAGLAGVGTYLFADTAITVVYGHRGFAPAGDILKVFGPGLFLMFIDVLFGYALTALGRAGSFSAVKVGSVVLSTVLDVVLIPYFQRTSGNGGIGAVLAFVLSEAFVFCGCLYLMPRGSLGSAVVTDGVRAVAAAVLTAASFRLLANVSPWLGIPFCVISFTVLSLALGLVKRADVDTLRALVRDRFARRVAAGDTKR